MSASTTPFLPRKIFFSYPHDDNARIVDRIRRDLQARGHEVWFDQSKIKTGDDWRGKITKGILGSDSVVAFLSRHSVRDPGVCLNELAIALAEKGDEALVTVLVEPETEVAAPVSITHIQWLRMEDWRARGDDDGWYRTQLERLIEVIENPASAGRDGELDQLHRVLDPLSFYSEIGRHLAGFTGRRWILDAYAQWLDSEKGSRVFRIEAGPGLGKTAIASQLAHASRSSVLGLFLCQSSRGESRNPLRLIQTLAYQMATRLPDYRARLLRVPMIRNPELAAGKNAADVWKTLIAEPLSGVGEKGLIERQRRTLLIDGLDEASESGRNPIAELLAEQIPLLPRWLGVVITSRPDPEVVRRLGRFDPEVVDGSDPRNLDDLRAYIDSWLRSNDVQPPLETSRLEAAAESLLDRSEGSFLYLKMAREDAQEGVLDLLHPEQLPRGLNESYLRFFERRFPDARNRDGFWAKEIRPLLSYVLASPEPLPIELARQLMGWDVDEDGDYREREVLDGLGSLLVRKPLHGEETLTLFHNSVREWLRDSGKPDGHPPAGGHFVSTRRARAPLTEMAWKRYLNRGEQDDYGRHVLPRLMPELQVQDEPALERILGSPAWETCQILWRLADSLRPRLKFFEAVGVYEILARFTKRVMDAEPDAVNLGRALSEVYVRLGDSQAEMGDECAAIKSHKRSLEVAGRLRALDSENGAYALGESVSYERLGTRQKIGGNRAAARELYEKCLDIRRELVARFPDDLLCSESLFVILNLLGSLQMESGDLRGAAQHFEKGLTTIEACCTEGATTLNTLDSLWFSHLALGDLKIRLKDSEAALLEFQRCLELNAAAKALDPASTKLLFQYAVTCNRLGDTYQQKGIAGAAAEFLYKSVEVARPLYAAAPEHPMFGNILSADLFRLGTLEGDRGNTRLSIELFTQSLEIDRLTLEVRPWDCGLVEYQWRTCMRIADMHETLGDTIASVEYRRMAVELGERLPVEGLSDDVLITVSLNVARLGCLYETQGNRLEAERSFRRANEIIDRIGLRSSEMRG